MSAPKVYGERFAVIPDAVLYAPVSSHAKVLWAVLARHADPHGRCFPSRTRLAELMAVSTNTIKRAKAELVEAKLIECHERYDDAGRRTSDDVFLTQARATGGPYGRATGGPTEVDPEEETPRYEVASGVSRVGGAKNETVALPPEHEALIAPLTDDDRQRGKDRLADLRALHGWTQ